MNEEDGKNKKAGKEKPGKKKQTNALTGRESKHLPSEDDMIEDRQIISNLPPHIKESFMEITSMGLGNPFLSSFASKINEKHIDKLIDINGISDERAFKDVQQSRRFQLVYVLIGVSVFVFLTLLLVGKDTELFKEIIKLFVAFVGGIGVGFGIKSHINSK